MSAARISQHPGRNNVWLALAWTLGIIAVFAPLSAWKYRRVVAQ